MDIGDINIIKEFKKTFVDPNGGDEGNRYAQRIKYELGVLIDINDKNISAKDFFIQSSLPKSNVNRYNTAVELSHTVGREYYKEFTNLVSLGNNLKEAAKKGFM